MKEKLISLQNYLESLQSEGQYWFLRKKAIKTLNVTDNAFRKSAYRLMKKGKLNRLRGDFYTLVPPEYRTTGCLPATWFIEELMGHLNQHYYVGLLTAAALHNSAHQQPMVFQVITNKLTRAITAGQVRIEFYYKKSIRPHFFQQIKTASGMMHVSTPEMTVFDLVRYMNAAGQVNNVATVLCELVERLNSDVLVKILEEKDVELSVVQRLGYLLEILKLEINLGPLENQLKKKKPIYRPLVIDSVRPVIAHNRRWHILVNELVEPDEL
jgi:predicted transcriptional regulator of viral defense system